jgi:hypothetical protein
MYIDKDTVYWLLSTAAQVYAALIAVFGALAVYRLQIASNFRGGVRERLIETLIDCEVHSNPYHLSVEDLIEVWEKYSPAKKEGWRKLTEPFDEKKRYNSIEMNIQALRNSIRHSKLILMSTVILTFAFFIFIAISLYGIFYTSQLTKDPSFLMDVTAFAIYLTLSFMLGHLWIVLHDEQK